MLNQDIDQNPDYDDLLADITHNTITYACKAIIDNNHKIVEQLIDKNNVNISTKKGIMLLHCAARYGRLEIMEYLINNGAAVHGIPETSIYKSGITPLHFASAHGHLECVERLLAAGANINGMPDPSLNEGKITPLHLAARHAHYEVVQQLITKGADFSVVIKNGETPLSIALEKGYKEIVDYLTKIQASTTPLYEQHLAEAVNNVRLDENPGNTQQKPVL